MTAPDSYTSLAELRTAVKVMEWWMNPDAEDIEGPVHEPTALEVTRWCPRNEEAITAMLEKTRKQIKILEGR